MSQIMPLQDFVDYLPYAIIFIVLWKVEPDLRMKAFPAGKQTTGDLRPARYNYWGIWLGAVVMIIVALLDWFGEKHAHDATLLGALHGDYAFDEAADPSTTLALLEPDGGSLFYLRLNPALGEKRWAPSPSIRKSSASLYGTKVRLASQRCSTMGSASLWPTGTPGCMTYSFRWRLSG